MIYTFLTFLETHFDEQWIYELAQFILKAQDEFEDSWSNVAGRYLFSQRQAAEMAAKTLLPSKAQYINLVADFNGIYWNDVQSWAQTVIKEIDRLREK